VKALRKFFRTVKPDHLDTYFKVDRSGNASDDATVERSKRLSHSVLMESSDPFPTNVVHQEAASMLSEEATLIFPNTRCTAATLGKLAVVVSVMLEEVENVFQTKSFSNVRNILPRRTERIRDHLKLALRLDEFSKQPSSHHLSIQHQ
jgi:hypothetical protein